MIGDVRFIDIQHEMEWLIQQLIWLKFDLFFFNLFRQVFSSSVISWNQIYKELSALFLFTDYWQGTWIVEHISESFGG